MPETDLTQNNDRLKQLHLNMAQQIFSRTQMFSAMSDPQRDINQECGYPDIITEEQYKAFYDREGIAARVVSLFPEESWAVDPIISETGDAEETKFEKAWIELENKLNFYHYLERGDELSGIGSYGILLLGIDDGKGLGEPVEGVAENGDKVGNSEHKLLFVRTFPQTDVSIAEFINDSSNPRFSMPLSYNVKFTDLSLQTESTTTQSSETKKVHWTRIIHLADNRKSSEIFGKPRLQDVFNRIYDLRKILSGSGEMFWKGAFPGYSFELDPTVASAGNVEIDKEGLREELERYSNGLQRYLALEGLTAKSLAPQAVDPSPHMIAQLKAIAITKGVPWRIFLGSEEAKLASDQDKRTFNTRIMRRQNKYLSPMVIRPVIDRLIAYGTLPQPTDGYTVEWPDMNIISDKDKAEVALKRTEAIGKYIQLAVNSLIEPIDFFTKIMHMDFKEAEAMLAAMSKSINDLEDDNSDGIAKKGNDDGED